MKILNFTFKKMKSFFNFYRNAFFTLVLLHLRLHLLVFQLQVHPLFLMVLALQQFMKDQVEPLVAQLD